MRRWRSRVNLSHQRYEYVDSLLHTHSNPLLIVDLRSGFNCTEEENETSLGALRRRAWLALIAKIKENAADASVLTKLRSNFEERFRYDDNGVPRVWKPEDDMDSAFQKARDDVRLLFRSADDPVTDALFHRP